MKITYKKLGLRLLDSLLAAAIVTAIAIMGWLDNLDNITSDWLYQESVESSSDIVIIGIDSATIDKLGKFSSWDRREIAKAINYLNNNDPNARPAVIGIDVMFSGEDSYNLEDDKQLAEAASKYKNVVVASVAAVNTQSLENDSDPYAKTWTWERPFNELEKVVDTGNIWGPDDDDGIVRHGIIYVNVKDDEKTKKLYSFSRVIYEKWCQQKEISPNPLPMMKDNGIFYLPFSAKSYNDDISFLDLIDGKISSEVYRDKIVLIGIRTSGMGEDFRIALDHSFIYGIEIHANEIQAFQRNFFPVEVGRNLQLAILFIICAAAEFFFRRLKILNTTILWIAICIGWFIICTLGYQYGEIILHTLWIPLLVSILFVGAVTTDYVRVQVEKIRVTSVFERYFDPTVMNKLIEGDSDAFHLGGKLQDIVVLFVDIRGFTTMSEKLPPSAIVDILNRYLRLTTECVRRHHGTLDKFIGDCTMAFWNAPLPQENPVLLACRAAMDMIEGSESLSKEIKEIYGFDITFGIGIHYGNAVVGNIGSKMRMDYTAIGDTVNTAARLEANAPGGKILISRTVADILGSSADITSLGDTITLKGKAKGFEVLMLNKLNTFDNSNYRKREGIID